MFEVGQSRLWRRIAHVATISLLSTPGSGMSRRGTVLILAHSVLIQIVVNAMRPALSYAVLHGGGSPVLLGVLSTAFAVPALVLALPAGHVIDRIGERFSLVGGAVCVVIAGSIAAIAHASILMLFAATVILGTGQLLSVIGEQSYVGNTAATGNSDSAFGHYGLSASFGQTLGPLLLALPSPGSASPPFEVIFVVCLCISVVMVAVSLLVRASTYDGAGYARRHMFAAAGEVLTTAGLPRALIASSIVIVSVDVFVAYAPLLGRDRQLSAVVVSLMLALRSVFSMLSRLFLGRMTKWLGRRGVLVWSVLLSAGALGFMAFPVRVAILIVLSGVFGFAVGICQPITMSWISIISPRGVRGVAMSLRLAANRLGQTTIPVALGLFAVVTGAGGVLAATGVLLLGATWSGAAIASPQKPTSRPE